MEEERQTRRAPLLVALAGILALAAIWATVAIAGSSAPAAKPVKAKAKATPAHSSYGTKGLSGKAGGHDCPNEGGTSTDL